MITVVLLCFHAWYLQAYHLQVIIESIIPILVVIEMLRASEIYRDHPCTQTENESILTEALGSHMVFTKARAALVEDLMTSVLPNLNLRVPPLSYVAVSFPYNLNR